MLGRLGRKLLTSGVCLVLVLGASACGGVDDPCSRCPPGTAGKALVAELDPEVKAGIENIGITPTYKGIKAVINKLASPKQATP